MNAQSTSMDENNAAARHGGQMTPEQQSGLTAAVRAETSSGLIGAGSAAALFLVFVLGSLNDARASGTGVWVFGGLLLLSLLLLGVLYWRRARLLAEVRAGQVARATGHVDWKAGRYRAEVAGLSLDLTGFNLAAGSYAFSYLPDSRRVVAAALAAADAPVEAQAELQHALAVANHFNLDDLSAYRQGRQGPGTFRRLRHLWSTTAWLLLAALALLGLFVYLVVTDPNQGLAPAVFLVAMLLGLWGLGDGLGALGRTRDMLGGQVSAVQGEVRKLKHETHGRYASTLYYYTLDGQNWPVSAEAWRALVEGPRYRLYYLPRSRALVGIEPLI